MLDLQIKFHCDYIKLSKEIINEKLMKNHMKWHLSVIVKGSFKILYKYLQEYHRNVFRVQVVYSIVSLHKDDTDSILKEYVKNKNKNHDF